MRPLWCTLLVTGALGACAQPATRAPGRLGCVASTCHARIEHIHNGGPPLDCVDCHGGTRTATTIGEAHVTTTVSFNDSSPGGNGPAGRLLANASLRELDELDPAVMQFLNPSDYRVVRRTCGSSTRGGGNCHARIVRNSVLSTHVTLSGQLAGGLYFGGLTDKRARFGVLAATDPFPSESAGTVPSLTLLPGTPDGLTPTGDVARDYYTSMGQICVQCHIARDGDQVPGLYTSSGCNACHLLTEDDGRPHTQDATQNVEEGGHIGRHRLTNLIPDSQCNRCHHTHVERGLLIQGVRERSEPEGDREIGGDHVGVEDPPNAVPWSSDHYVRYQGAHNLYGKLFPFYIEDEDGTNDVDETPPDIHFERGLACIDCHTTGELHGTDHISQRREFETRIRCESCHGTPSQAINPDDVPFNQARSRVGGNADNLPVIQQDDTGAITELGKLDGRTHPVTQISRRVDPSMPRFNPRTQMGCGLHSGDAALRATLLARFQATPPDQVDDVFPGMPEGSTLAADLGSRAGRVECFTCHNTWTINCYGCHVVRDDRSMARDLVTGEMVAGRVSNFAMSVLSDALALGFSTRGRVSPMVGTSIFFTHISSTGETLIDAAPLLTTDGFSGDANEHNPVHHHTVRRQPRDCQGCHPRADGPDDEDALKRVVGFGTGRYIFVDGAGTRHILDRLVAIDFDGDGEYDDPATTRLGTTARSVMPLAASTHMPLDPAGPHPGPLDLETINRILQNRVVPQRP